MNIKTINPTSRELSGEFSSSSAISGPILSGSRRHSTEKRRREILDAALACFLKNGVEGTTIGQICQASKASHGSIYHLFRSKDEIALTLFVEGMHIYHRKIIAALAEPTTARESIQAIVAAHLQDVVDDPELSIYLTRLGMADGVEEISRQYQTLNDEFVQTVWKKLQPFVESGQLIQVPRELYFSIIIGPAAHLSRNWIRGRIDFDLMSAVQPLAEAAWNSLQADQHREKIL